LTATTAGAEVSPPRPGTARPRGAPARPGTHPAANLAKRAPGHSNSLLSVERVTELNAGRATAGVDGEVAPTDEAMTELVARLAQ